jgi:membrane fusion protein, copper/silver efflux system
MSDGSGIRHRIWAFVRVMNVRLRFVFLMVLTGLIAANWENIGNHWERWTRPKSATEAGAISAYEYYCPMHPSVVRGEPGNCPICGMPLTKREKGEAPELPAGTLARVQLSPQRMELGGIGTSEVGYRPVEREIRTVGTIELDERRVAHIAARTAGRVEKLYVDFTGEKVGRGDPLVDVYSPELISTQQEYLLALRTFGGRKDAGAPGAAAAGASTAGTAAGTSSEAKSLLDASRERLRLWGVGDDQIADLEREGKPRERLTIRSPISGTVTAKKVQAGQYVGEGTEMYTIADLSSVWMTGSIYEADAGSVRVGQPVEVRSSNDPDRVFHGEIAFVQPVVEAATRTLRIRVNVPNPDGNLRPGAYVDVRIDQASGASSASGSASAIADSYECPMGAEFVSDRPGKCPKCGMDIVKVERGPAGQSLAIPESAVIDTGTRKIVYLEREPGIFDALEVKLGPHAGGYYPVLEGLTAGDRIVTAGAFLVDAEGRLNPAAASSYFGASGGPSAGKP